MSKIALVFLMVFFGGTIATFTYNGAASFLLYQFVYFLNPDARWWAAEIPGISYSFVASVLMLISLGFGYRRYSALAPWGEIPAFKWILALVLYHYLVYFWALNPALHYQFTFQFTKLVIIVFVAYKLVTSPRILDVSIWAYLIGATYIGYLATSVGRGAGARVEGIGMADAPDANDTAAALVPAAVFLMYYAWLGSKKVKLLCFFCGALIANGLVLINSRGSFVGVVFSAGLFLLYMMFSRYRKEGQRAMAVVIIILGISGGLYVADDQFWDRMRTMENVEDGGESGSHRVIFWLAALDISKDHPLGTGVYGFNSLSSVYLPPEYHGGEAGKSVHSLWFQGLNEVGWPGISLFAIALISLFRLSRKAKKWVLENDENVSYFKLLALECALLGYLAAGSFINRFRAEILYWMILLLAIGINVYFLQRHKAKAAGAKSHVDRDTTQAISRSSRADATP